MYTAKAIELVSELKDQPSKQSHLGHGEAKERGTQSVPFFIKILPSETREDAEHKEEEKEKNERRLTDYTAYLFFATAFLGIATLGLAFVAYGQMWEARGRLYT